MSGSDGMRAELGAALARVTDADRISNPEPLLADAQAWAAELSKGSAAAIALSKSILNRSFELSAEQVFAQGSQAQAICYTTSEHHDSVLAFLNKTSNRE
jgi:enoyl-CoA hydratase/carnithine racemase